MHAQRTIFAQIKDFNANRRVPSGFLNPRNSILRSFLVDDCTSMRRRGFLRNSKLFTLIVGYLVGLSGLKARFRGLFKYVTARTYAGEVFYTIQSFNRDSECT